MDFRRIDSRSQISRPHCTGTNRDGNDLQSRGLFLDLGPWQSHVFRLSVETPGP
jgi:hypothetical protein